MGCGDSASANDAGEAEQGETITSPVGGDSAPSSQNVSSSSSKKNTISGLSSSKQRSSSSVNQDKQKSSQSTPSSSSKKVESSSAKKPSDFNGLTREDYLNDEIEYLEFEDERDHQKYKYVKIGSLYWMSQNLNYSDSVNTKSLTEGRSFCYNDNPSNCDVAGRMYTWSAAIDSLKVAADSGTFYSCGLYDKNCALHDKSIIQGICPEGWRLPNVSDWSGLIYTIKYDKTDSLISVPERLKAKVGWDLYEYHTNGSDAYGFSAIPGGDKSKNYGGNGYAGLHELVGFWSASPYGGNLTERGGITEARGYAILGNCNVDSDCSTIKNRSISNGRYIRCVMDVETP